MNDVDVSKIKVGDVVGVRVLEVSRATGSYRIESSPDYLGAWVCTPAIVSHTPAPRPALKVGDRVKPPTADEREIVWISANHIYLSPHPTTGLVPRYHRSTVETWERV